MQLQKSVKQALDSLQLAPWEDDIRCLWDRIAEDAEWFGRILGKAEEEHCPTTPLCPAN